MSETSASDGLFQNIKYFVTGTVDDNIQKLLESGGATRCKFLIDFVTHVICGKDYDETQIAEAQDLYELPAVEQKWVMASIKLGRLASTLAYNPLPNKLFSQLKFALTGGLTPNDNKILYALIRFHGGQIDRNYTEKTNHLICPSATGAAYAKAMAVGNERTKIVTPDWITDCIQEGQLVDTANYHPRLLIVSSMVIERKIIQVGLVENSENKGDGEKKQPKSGATATQSGIGAMIRPVKATSGILNKNIIIQQHAQVVRPSVSTASGSQLDTNSENVGDTKVPTTPPSQIVHSSPTTTVVNIQQIPQSQAQIKLTQQPTAAGQLQQQTQRPDAGKPVTITTIPKPQMVNTQQIQFIQQNNQGVKQTMIVQTSATGQIIAQGQGGTVSGGGPSTIAQIVNPSGNVQIQQQIIKAGQAFSTQGTASGVPTAQLQGPPSSQAGPAAQQIVQIQQSQQTIANQAVLPQQTQQQHPGQQTQFQKHIILSQQQLAQLQQQPAAATAPQNQQQNPQNILIIQNTGGGGDPQQTGGGQQSQSVPQSPVQTPQFSNVQFIRSNSQPAGTTMAGGAAVGGGGPQIQLQQVNFQMQQHAKMQQTIVQGNPQQTQLQIQQQQQAAGQGGVGQQQNQMGGGGQVVTIQQQHGGSNAPGGNMQGQGVFIQQGPHQQLQPGQQPQQMGQQQQVHQMIPGGRIVQQQIMNIQGGQQQQQIIAGGGGPQSQMMGAQQQQRLVVQQGQSGMQQPTAQMIVSQQVGQGQQTIQQQQQGGVQQWTTQTGGAAAQTIQVQAAAGAPGQPPMQGQPFIRAGVRGPGPQQQQQQQSPQQWVTGSGGTIQGGQGVPQRHLIQLDPQAQAQWAMMDPAKKAEYIAKLQSMQTKRNIMLRQQVFQNRPGAPTAGVVTTRMSANGQQHIVFRGQVPSGLTPQQQVQWIQQQRQQQILVRPNAPGLSPIQQQQHQQHMAGGVVGAVVGGGGGVSAGGQVVGQGIVQAGQVAVGQVPMDPNVVGGPRPQFARMASHPGGQKIIQQQQQIGGQTIQTRYVTIDGSPLNPEQVQQMVQAGGDGLNQPQIISKTKTALANMLNSRMTTGSTGSVSGSPMPDGTVEPSAAGTLRLMTAHHNATLNQSMGPRTPQELMALQQRRTLGNITNAAGAGPSPGPVMGPGGALVTGPVGAAVGPGGHMAMAAGGTVAVGRAPQPRPQFYGHNPNLPKLPPELFLLGCNFYIVEYDETHANDLVVWKELIRKHGGEIEAYYCPKVTHVLCRSQRHGVVMQAIRDTKRCVTAFWLNDTIVKKQLLPPWQALHLPAPSTFGRQRPATRHIVGISGFEGEERQRIKKMVEETGAKLTSYFSKQNTVLVCKRLDGPKYKRAKDWAIPVVNASWLSDILMGNLSSMSNYDITKYQQYNLNCPFRIEYGLVPHLMTSWKSPVNLNQESHERLKRCHSEPVPGPKPKRVRTLPPLEQFPEAINVTKLPGDENVPKVIFSQVDNKEGLTKAVTAFGGIVVTEPAEATHLVMTRLVRTCKLLQCLCTVNHVVTSDWLVESVRAGELLPEDKFQIHDKPFEAMFKADIHQTVKSPNRDKLFEGRTFHMTPSVRPTVKEMAKLIEMCGGKVEKKARSLLKIHEANTANPNSYIVLSCPQDLHLLADIMRSKQHSRIICTTEFVMRSVMNQVGIDMEPHIIRYV